MAFCWVASAIAEIEMNQHRRATIIFLVALGAVTLWFCYLIARPFLEPAFMALVLAIIFRPLHAGLRRRIRSRNAAALLSTLCVLLMIIVPAFLLSAALRSELTAVYQSLTSSGAQEGGLIARSLQLVEKTLMALGGYVHLPHGDLRAELSGRLQQFISFLLSHVADFASSVTSFVVAAVVTFFTLFYVFRDGRALWRRVVVLIPLSTVQLKRLTNGVSNSITASLNGGLAVAVAQGALLGVAFWVLGLPSPVLWGMITGFCSLIPLVGTSLVWLPSSIILIVVGHPMKGMILLAWGAGAVSTVDNVIRPLVISDKMQFHPLYVFFALLGGVQAFGVIGLFVGPVVLALAQSLFGLVREETHKQSHKDTVSAEEQPATQRPGRSSSGDTPWLKRTVAEHRS